MRLRPVSIYNVPAYQAWLEDQAAKGVFLYDFFSGFFARFEPGEPKAVRYRLQPLTRVEDGPSLEQRELYEESGWDYVADAGGEFRIWRCDDPDAPELDTDPVVQGGAYTRICRRLRWSNAIIALLLVGIPGLCLYFLHQTDRARLMWYVQSEVPAWRLIPLLMILLFSLWLLFYQNWAIRTLVRTLRAGLPVPHRAPWRRQVVLGGVSLAVYVLWIAFQLLNLAWIQPREFPRLADLPESVPFVSLAALNSGISASDGGFADPIHNWMTEEQWWIQESGRRHGQELSCTTRYYRLRFHLLTDGLMRDIRSWQAQHGTPMQYLEDSRFDSAYFGEASATDNQVLLLRRGAQVLQVEYEGTADLREHLDEFRAVFDRPGEI